MKQTNKNFTTQDKLAALNSFEQAAEDCMFIVNGTLGTYNARIGIVIGMTAPDGSFGGGLVGDLTVDEVTTVCSSLKSDSAKTMNEFKKDLAS